MTAFIACHSAVRSIDDLCQIVRNLGKGSSLENFEMHRTKCANVIQHVISHCMLKKLVEDVDDTSYSLIVDKSTYFYVFKYLCLCIKYFSKSRNRFITDYLRISVESTTHDVLYEVVQNFLEKIGLNEAQMIGFGTDGESNFCGKHNSLFALLKRKNHNLQLIRCVCHSRLRSV